MVSESVSWPVSMMIGALKQFLRRMRLPVVISVESPMVSRCVGAATGKKVVPSVATAAIALTVSRAN